MNDKKALLDAAIEDPGALLQYLYKEMAIDSESHKTATTLLRRWKANKKDSVSGIISSSEYNIERNRIFEALQEWIRASEGQSLALLKAPVSLPKETYKILSISPGKTEEEKMKELFLQTSGFEWETSSATNIDTLPFDIIIFDNFISGPIKNKAELNKLDTKFKDKSYKKNLETMANWLEKQNAENTALLAPTGFIIHYGKYCYLLDGYNNCAAANFPFTLIDLIKQIISFWDSQKQMSKEVPEKGKYDG